MDTLNTDKARDAAESAKKSATKVANKAIDKATDRANEVTDMVAKAADRGFAAAKDQLDVLRDESAEFMKSAEKSIRKNPLAAIAIAAGVGIVFAGLTGFAARSLSR